jgi:recombinational DNA repair protein RecR
MKMREFTTTHQPQTTERALEFTQTVIVNREQLAEALKDARHVSSVLHMVESLADLDWEEMCDLCRTASRAAQLLAGMLEAKEVQER